MRDSERRAKSTIDEPVDAPQVVGNTEETRSRTSLTRSDQRWHERQPRHEGRSYSDRLSEGFGMRGDE